MSFSEVPTTPMAYSYQPDTYRAFSDFITNPCVFGIGANVGDVEILRLACLEKLRRDGPSSKSSDGFKLNFIANQCADWAESRVQFWEEGLGIDWNLLVFTENATLLLARVLFHGPPQYLFVFLSIPARLPGLDCEIHENYTVCKRNDDAPPLTGKEKSLWEFEATSQYGSHWPGFDWEE